MIIASMYHDINQQIDIDMLQTEAIIQQANNAGILIAMDSNSKSSSWHNILTNRRGRMLEEFLMSKVIYNERGELLNYLPE
jgi:uncharacterized membrane protein affecting hemolysin expression